MLSRENPTAQEFEEFYAEEDPWHIKNTLPQLGRVAKLNAEFADCRFEKGLDVGCGEGTLTAALKFVSAFDAIDFSERALARAKAAYPGINFLKADLTDLSCIEDARYDFISCFEAIYYISSDREREQALLKIRDKGSDNCVFCFSVVTIGENQYRRYFTYQEALNFFGKHFNVIKKFPISLAPLETNLLVRAVRRIRRMLLPDSRRVAAYLEQLNDTNIAAAYQFVFVLTKKTLSH